VHSAGPHFGPRPSVWPGPAAQAMWQAQLGWPAWRASSCGHHAWCGHSGAADPGSSMDKAWQKRLRKHRGTRGHAPNMEAAAGTHPCGTTAVRCEGGGSTAVSEAVEAL
jgi:hypothetical protein